MEQDRAGRGRAPVRRAHGRQVAGAGLAAVDNKKAQRQELERGKAAGVVDVATV
jgi:hypothetical protein